MSRLVNNIGERILRKNRKKLDRVTQVHNFDTAKTAYIIFDASMHDAIPLIQDFRKYLTSQSIQSKAIGIVEEKEIPSELLMRKNYSFLTKKDKNWYKRPKGEVVEKFMADKPNILFDFTFRPSLEVQYLVQLSGADFKVGCFTEDENDYDLMINPSKDCELEYFVEQVRHYISILNPS